MQQKSKKRVEEVDRGSGDVGEGKGPGRLWLCWLPCFGVVGPGANCLATCDLHLLPRELSPYHPSRDLAGANALVRWAPWAVLGPGATCCIAWSNACRTAGITSRIIDWFTATWPPYILYRLRYLRWVLSYVPYGGRMWQNKITGKISMCKWQAAEKKKRSQFCMCVCYVFSLSANR